MTRSRGMWLAAALAIASGVPGAIAAQQPITSASPTLVQTDPAAGNQTPTPPGAASATTAPAAAEPAGDAAPTAATPAKAPIPQFYKADPTVGQPIPGGIALQKQVTELGEYARWFDTDILIPIITIICLFVLGLLIWVILRFNQRARPVPSVTSHNTVLEILWTVAPVLILLGIAVPSIKLLARQYDTPKPDLTVKAIGHQWYWSYQYPDNGDFEIVSNMLDEEKAKANGEPYHLAVDERMVVPAGAVVKVISTSDDVIHSFAVPAFWTKMDAVPGRLNETWFKVDKPGVYYGQCSELCGARHGYMPIAVEVVTRPQFAQWIAARGGTMPGAVKPTSSDATQNSPVSNPTSTTASPDSFGGAVNTTPTVDAAATPKPVAGAATTN